MGSILSAIDDDMEEYRALCKHFGESVQSSKDAYGNWLPDCYGEHAKSLKKRRQEEFKAKKEMKKEYPPAIPTFKKRR